MSEIDEHARISLLRFIGCKFAYAGRYSMTSQRLLLQRYLQSHPVKVRNVMFVSDCKQGPTTNIEWLIQSSFPSIMG